MAHGAAASLIAAAETLEAAGQSLQAIKCLEAALSSGALLPTAEVVARVRLATCLLRHTDCAVTAKFRLEPAQLLLKRLAGAGHQSACAPLQADFFSALAAVYERLPGYGAKCKAALKKGLQITLQSQGWEGAARTASHFHFRLRLAECLRLEGDTCGALAVLEEAVISKDVDAATTQLHALATLQTMLLVGTCGAAKELECAGRVRKLIHSTTADPALQGWPNADLMYTLLHGLMLLRHGATSETGELCTSLRSQLEQHSGCDINALTKNSAGAVSPRVTLALIHLVLAATYRPSGKFVECAQHLNKAAAALSEELASLHVPAATGLAEAVGEAHLSTSLALDVRPVVQLQYLLKEMEALSALTLMALPEAQAAALAAVDLYRRFPTALAPFAGSLHALVGHYCHTVALYADAFRHFQLAQQLSQQGTSSRVIAEVGLALAALAHDTPAMHSVAQDALLPLCRRMEELAGAQDQAAVLLGSGVAKAVQGEAGEARVRLTRALRLAHGTVANHQLVAQSLGLLGSLTVGPPGEVQGALDMLTNARILAKNLGDVPAHRMVLEQLAATAGDLSSALSQEKASKCADHEKRVNQAIGTKQHEPLLRFEASA